RVLVDGSLGFSSINSLDRMHVENAIEQAIKLAKVSPADRFNSMPSRSKITLLDGIYDTKSESFGLDDAVKLATEMLFTAKSFDKRISVDSGNFSSSIMYHGLLNSNGVRAEEAISSFSWSIMGMALNDNDNEVSNFDLQYGGTHYVGDINVATASREFAKTVINSLHAQKIESFRGKMLLSPSAATELIQDVLAYSINSQAVQKNASKFQGKIGSSVASDVFTLEDDATNTSGLASSSFDREGVPHQRNTVIENGILRSFLYNTYTANKDNTQSTGNAGGSPKTPPVVSTSNVIVKPGKSKLENLIAEIDRGVIINRFSGNVNPVNGDFSGVVKGGHYIRNGISENAVKEVMVAGNVFDALYNLAGLSEERKILSNSILPYMLFDNISFTAG
ncbi:MAG TPA: metallopeptidase TldD-related protein, partial [Nitrososphaeraceae archaeon]|nr:metallopeptidase TldD-related protein [Nitrososphaeraceae archaeon]